MADDVIAHSCFAEPPSSRCVALRPVGGAGSSGFSTCISGHIYGPVSYGDGDV